MAEDTFTLDVRIEIDEFDLEDLRRALDDAEESGRVVSRVKMRNVQWKALKRRAGDRYGVPDLQTVFGHDIVIEEDGLTPRQRGIKRIEAELGRTRAQQVADFLRDEDDSAHLFDFANVDLEDVKLAPEELEVVRRIGGAPWVRMTCPVCGYSSHTEASRAPLVCPNEGRRLLRDRDGTRAKAIAATKAARKTTVQMTNAIAQFGTLGMSAGEATNALAANLRRMSR